MTDNALLYRPCLEHFAYKGQNKFPPVIEESKLNKELNWKNDNVGVKANIPLTDFLYTEEFETYCQDPFDETSKHQFMQMLEVPRMILEKRGPDGEQIWVSDESVKLKPPFFISYKTMAIDAGLGM